MSLDKAIQHGKEHRKPYKGSKLIDRTCRNHGGCDWCKGNRMHKYKKQEEKMNNDRNRNADALAAESGEGKED